MCCSGQAGLASDRLLPSRPGYLIYSATILGTGLAQTGLDSCKNQISGILSGLTASLRQARAYPSRSAAGKMPNNFGNELNLPTLEMEDAEMVQERLVMMKSLNNEDKYNRVLSRNC